MTRFEQMIANVNGGETTTTEVLLPQGSIDAFRSAAAAGLNGWNEGTQPNGLPMFYCNADEGVVVAYRQIA